MKDGFPTHPPYPIRTKAAGNGYITVFTIFLFIVILSVVAWAMHRRLAEYDTVLPTMHQSTATKVCLTERTQIPLPRMHGIDSFTMLFEIFVLATTLFALCNSEASLQLQSLHDKRYQSYPARSKPSLTHFFCLPPPSLPSLL